MCGVGSGWKEYKSSGTVHGINMPVGLQECEKLERPLFTPSTKAEQGEHDVNIHPDKCNPLPFSPLDTFPLYPGFKISSLPQIPN